MRKAFLNWKTPVRNRSLWEAPGISAVSENSGAAQDPLLGLLQKPATSED